MRYVVTTLVALLVAVPAIANNAFEDISVIAPPSGNAQGPIAASPTDQELLYSNGAMSNWICPTDDESHIEPDNCGTYGFGCQLPLGYWVADDFTVPAGDSWTIENIRLFGYQTNATFPSINDVRYQIWFGQPGQAGSLMVCDITGALDVAEWAEGPFTLGRILRTNGQGVCTTARIQQSLWCFGPGAGPCTPLAAGTWWLAFQYAGSGSSGPWVAPVVPGTPAHNALQSLDDGLTWNPLLDTACSLNKDVGFELWGPASTPVETTTWGAIKQTF